MGRADCQPWITVYGFLGGPGPLELRLGRDRDPTGLEFEPRYITCHSLTLKELAGDRLCRSEGDNELVRRVLAISGFTALKHERRRSAVRPHLATEEFGQGFSPSPRMSPW
jgi:hypothetical protein